MTHFSVLAILLALLPACTKYGRPANYGKDCSTDEDCGDAMICVDQREATPSSLSGLLTCGVACAADTAPVCSEQHFCYGCSDARNADGIGYCVAGGCK